jgi:UDP-2,3-diacylglucosamine pyrophosphatase LpxH
MSSTLIISDLHLGSGSGSDLLRLPELREPLLQAVADVDRVVLLGDVLELRHGPVREAMTAARPFFEDLGLALGEGELIMTLGNHDHALIEPWLASRGAEADPGRLEPEQLLEPAEVSPTFSRIAQWCAPARLRIAYPGVWVREDVYAMHGHYLDCHLTVPTLERLSVGLMSRLLRRPASSFSGADDYEAMGAPVFAWRDAVARDAHPGATLNGVATVMAWQALGGSGAASPGRATPVRAGRVISAKARMKAIRGAFPLAVGALNKAGIGPLKSDISAAELRRAGLEAMGEVAARMDLGDAYVVFGHTHRAGPFPGDDEGEWRGRGGARLVNCGSWTYTAVFMDRTGSQNPYWPGVCVTVGPSGPPVLSRLLEGRAREDFVAARSDSP